VLVRVPQHLEVPSLSSTPAGAASPRVAARAEPAERAKLPLPRSSCARACCERALPVVDLLLENLHAADERGEVEHHRQGSDELSVWGRTKNGHFADAAAPRELGAHACSAPAVYAFGCAPRKYSAILASPRANA